MKTVAYYNGTVAPIEELTIPANDRAVYFGDGIYDVAIADNYHTFRLADHVNRFFCSAKQMKIPFDMTKEELSSLLEELLQKMDAPGNAMIYWQISRGTAPRAHVFPSADVKANLLVMIKPMSPPTELKHINLITTPETRYSYCNIKTINLIPNVLASQKAKNAGCEEAVFHKDGIVSECSHSNIHILKDGTLQTAPLSPAILPGITRMHLLALAQENSIPVNETAFTLEQLMDADEVLVTSSTALIRVADSVDGIPVGGKDSETLMTLVNAYQKLYRNSVQE
ncbi:MAG: aminotransferase class IV [Lachnospiraceae bacterium]|nr:aminotransferase class IV [Lachnospiraceae bacterium]